MVAALTGTTIAVVTLVVIVLAYHLIAIVRSLRQTAGNLAHLASTLEAIADNTAPVPGRLGAVRDTMQRLHNDLEATDQHLTTIARLLVRPRIQ